MTPEAPCAHAVVLAGGAGTRMPPLATASHPKAMLTVGNRPMVFYPLYSLLLAGVRSVTVVVAAGGDVDVESYCREGFAVDPAVVAAGRELVVDVRAGVGEGTADVLRALGLKGEVLILGCDYIGDVELRDVVRTHRENRAVCTVALYEGVKMAEERIEEEVEGTGKKKGGGQKKSNKKDAARDSGYDVSQYALVDGSGARLLGLYGKVDLENGVLKLRASLVQRYPTLHLRSDLFDPHVYVLAPGMVWSLLHENPNISSLKYDLIPYLARRQHTLARVADKEGWECPGDNVSVAVHIVENSAYVKRANTVDEFLSSNADVAAGRLDAYLGKKSDGEGVTGAKKKGKKPEVRQSPFEKEGERVSVTPDSLVGFNVSAGDRTSVKKSVVGPDTTLGSNVKINGCVLLRNVTLEDGVNLTGCVVCESASIGKDCVLKDCRIAGDVAVPAGTDAKDREFSMQTTLASDGLGDDFEFY